MGYEYVETIFRYDKFQNPKRVEVVRKGSQEYEVEAQSFLHAVEILEQQT